MKTLQIFFVCLILGIGQVTVTHAAEVKFLPEDIGQGDWFGFSVSISGDTVIAGTPFNAGTGSAYISVFDNGNWIQEAKLVAADLAAKNWFGFSVSISEANAIVGAPLHNVADVKWTSAAYIFVRKVKGQRAEWEEQAKLIAKDAGKEDEFGYAVAVSGDTAIIGAHLDSHEGAEKAGSAYIFVRERDGWKQQTKLIASDAAEKDEFGRSIAIHKNTVIIGAHLDDDSGSKSGAAYIFAREGETWSEQAKLTASDAAARDEFGTSVAISGRSVIVGSPLDDDAGSKSGSAYIFARNGGVE